ncbi:Uncharacterized protein TCM_013118 [Theobroma cacao]|uniref:Uncharacterized protein n=1 Tax=Theobroma cacao TaxID=3641 RepID=A0A061FWN9_THECC|nr:Uncharacterized protein TCM_013118 [Theobroma cacao]
MGCTNAIHEEERWIDELRIKKENVPKTAFRTRYGHYEFLVMSFELTNVLVAFMVIMNQVLKPCLDKEHRLYTKFFKCELWLDSVTFLGHIVLKEGMKVDLKKIKVVEKWLRPTLVIEIWSFLCLAEYYRKFVKDFSKIATPMAI